MDRPSQLAAMPGFTHAAKGRPVGPCLQAPAGAARFGRLARLFCVLLALPCLSGIASGHGDSGASGPAPAAVAGKADTPDTPAARAPAQLEEVSISMNTDAYPYSYCEEDGKMQGFSVELSEAIARVMNFRIRVVRGDADSTSEAFLAGKADTIQVFYRNAERQEKADFSEPYLRLWASIIVRRDEQRIRGVSDLAGRRVLVPRNNLGEGFLRGKGLRDEIVLVNSVPEALTLLSKGEGDATIATRLTALSLARRDKLDNLEPRGPALDGYYADYCYAVHKGDTRLLGVLNQGLAVVRSSGEFDRIYDKWFGQIDRKGYTETEILVALLVGISVALLVAIVSAFRRRRLMVELRGREEMYRGVFESAHEAFMVLGPGRKGSAPLELQQANAAACRCLGLPSDLPEACTLLALLPHDPGFSERVAAALGNHGPRVFEHEHPAGDVVRHLVVSITPIGGRVLLVLTDLTEIKAAQELLIRSEQQLQQTQKLEAIGTLASGVAHDFNNILTGIMGNVELARLDLEDGTDPRTSIDQIMLSAERARQLVRQILTFSRKTEAQRELIELSPIVVEALRFVRAATPSSITICHRKSDTLPRVEADATQLHQVIMNLCTNAVHAMSGRNGTLEVVEESVTVDPSTSGMNVSLESGDYVKISVRDTGCGMEANVLQRIFDPFFTTKAPGEGTGLGLSVVHGIVRKHGGVITVYSQPGQGTVFHVYLPAGRLVTAVQGNGIASSGLILGSGEQILVVDDETVIVKATRLMLQRLGYEVTGFNTPTEAEESFRAAPERFDLLITDLTMPGMSGIELAERIHKVRPGLPVLLMSGFIGELDLERIKRQSFAGILDKPLSLDVLSRRVREALQADTSAML